MAAVDADQAGADLLSERNYLTILFVDIQRSNGLVAEMDPEQAVSLLEPALQVMREAVRRHGGTVSNELGDGIKALFGAPASNAWHAAMACHAALDIVGGIARLGDPRIHVRCGVHSHTVVARATRGDHSPVHDATGPAAHLANRLQAAAGPGEVFVSDTCRALCEGMFGFEALPPVALRGFPRPVPMHRVTGLRTRSLWQARAAHSVTPFAGRGAEAALLRTEARQARVEGLRAAAVLGELGVGKSRLVQECLDPLAAEGWTVATCACHPAEAGRAYAVAAGILARLHPALADPAAELPDADLPTHAGAAIATILDRPVADPGWAVLEPPQRLDLVVQTFRALLAAAATGAPVAMLVDDAHWIDRQSAEVLRIVLQPALHRPVLLVATSREGEAPFWLPTSRTALVRLAPLAADAGSAILDAVLGPAPALAPLKQRILRHTCGVPLFIEEVVRHLHQAGILARDLPAVDLLDAFGALDVPLTVQGVIGERIDRLGPAAKEVLQAASVVGTGIDIPPLAAVTGRDEAGLGQALAGLQEAGLLVAAPQGNLSHFAFAHDLVREVAYDSLLAHDREAGHARVLALLEEAEAPAELLCHHAEHARDWPRVARYAEDAFRRCVSRTAYHEAARHLDLAIAAVDRLPPAPGLAERSIDLRLEGRLALPPLGRFAAWMGFATQALERAEACGDRERMLAARVEQASAANVLHDPPEAMRYGEAALAAARQAGTPRWLYRAGYALAQAHMTAGAYRSAIPLLDQALEQLEAPPAAPDSDDDAARVLRYAVLCSMMKAVAHAAMGNLARAEAAQRRAAAHAEAAGRPYERIAASYGRGFVSLQWGRLADAEAALRTGLDLAERYSVDQFSPVVACQWGRLLLARGDAASAADALVGARDLARQVGDAVSQVCAGAWLGLALAERGEHGAALREGVAAVEMAGRHHLDGARAEALLAEATIRLHGPGPDEVRVRAALQEAIRIGEATGARPLVAAAASRLAALLRHQGRDADAETLGRQARLLLAGMGMAPI